MQSIFSYAIEFVFCAFVAHTAIHFASGLVSLWNSDRSAPVVENQEYHEWDEERIAQLYAKASQDEGFLAEIQEPVAQPVLTDAVVPFVRPKSATQTVNVADLLQPKSIRQLKKIASAFKLPRYCNDSKNRLIARLLSEVDAARLQEVIAG